MSQGGGGGGREDFERHPNECSGGQLCVCVSCLCVCAVRKLYMFQKKENITRESYIYIHE